MNRKPNPITIKDSKVLISAAGVTPVKNDMSVIREAVLSPASNRLHATPDRQALALYMVALVRTMANSIGCQVKLQARRDWNGPHFIVDASTLAGAPLVNDQGKDESGKVWNDQAFLTSALRWAEGLAPLAVDQEIGMVRLDDRSHRHFFKVLIQDHNYLPE